MTLTIPHFRQKPRAFSSHIDDALKLRLRLRGIYTFNGLRFTVFRFRLIFVLVKDGVGILTLARRITAEGDF